MRCEIKNITPTLAASWLKKNINNRSYNDHHAVAMSRDFKNGKAVENGESIKFDTDDRLIDGQHRLHAILKSGITLKMIVVTGLDTTPGVQNSIDIGRKRSFGDQLHIAGYHNGDNLAGAISFLISFERGIVTGGGGTRPTPFEKWRYLLDHPDVETSLSTILSYRKKCTASTRSLLTPSSAAGLHYHFKDAGVELADEFFERLATGENMRKTHPVMVLRERLIQNALSTHQKLSTKAAIAITIKAWNSFVGGKQIKSLRWNVTSDGKERLPDIIKAPRIAV